MPIDPGNTRPELSQDLDRLVNRWRQLNDQRLDYAANVAVDDHIDLVDEQRRIADKISHLLAYDLNYQWHWNQ